MQSSAEPNRRDDTEPDPVNHEEGILSDPLDVNLMLSWDVPECEERNENQRHQSNGLFVVQEASLVELK